MSQSHLHIPSINYSNYSTPINCKASFIPAVSIRVKEVVLSSVYLQFQSLQQTHYGN